MCEAIFVKLFQRLLIAPAALGLLVPFSSSGSEVTMNDFDPAEEQAISKNRVDGLDAKLNNFEAGSFSDTTALSGSASFQLGAVDGSNISEAVTATYSYELDLNTTFTGDDNLYVGIETGNGGYPTVDFSLDSSGGGADTLNVTSMYYQFPLGSYEVAVGSQLDNDDLMPTTLSKYSDKFFMAGSNGGLTAADFYYAPGITGSGIAIARTFNNGFNASASVIGLSASTADGFLTDEGTDSVTLSAGYDGENYGLGLIYTDVDETCSFIADYQTCDDLGLSSVSANSTSIGGYWTPNEGKTILSVSIGVLSAEVPDMKVEDLSEAHLGIDYELGEGVLSAAIKSSEFYSVSGSTASSDDLGEFAEIYYTYDVNDSMEITGGISFAMGDGDGVEWLDRTAFGGSATFKF